LLTFKEKRMGEPPQWADENPALRQMELLPQ